MTRLIERILKGFAESPKIAILMSGGGSNARVILEERHRYPDLRFSSIVTDRKQSNGKALALEFGLDFAYIPGSVKTLQSREETFSRMADYLRQEDVDFLIYAGFMKISPPDFCQEFPGINTHPADLTLLGENGKPRYVGIQVVEEAVQCGETYLACTVHVVDSEVDCGQPIAVSCHLPLEGLDKGDPDALHGLLKTRCEHPCFPAVLDLLASGSLSLSQLPIQLDPLLQKPL